MVKEQAPDVFIAGPAFNAGRYGVACGTIAAAVQEELGIPSLTGMYVENPGADMFKNQVCMISTKNSAAGMRDAVTKMAPMAVERTCRTRTVRSVEQNMSRTVLISPLRLFWDLKGIKSRIFT